MQCAEHGPDAVEWLHVMFLRFRIRLANDCATLRQVTSLPSGTARILPTPIDALAPDPHDQVGPLHRRPPLRFRARQTGVVLHDRGAFADELVAERHLNPTMKTLRPSFRARASA
jgi:hypothetical protein